MVLGIKQWNRVHSHSWFMQCVWQLLGRQRIHCNFNNRESTEGTKCMCASDAILYCSLITKMEQLFLPHLASKDETWYRWFYYGALLLPGSQRCRDIHRHWCIFDVKPWGQSRNWIHFGYKTVVGARYDANAQGWFTLLLFLWFFMPTLVCKWLREHAFALCPVHIFCLNFLVISMLL